MVRVVPPLLTLFVALLLVVGPSDAGDVGLRWEASSGATGYRIHYGTTPGDPIYTVDVGNTTQTVLRGLADCTTLYFAVSAYNNGGESQHSNEVSSWTRPSIGVTTPTAVRQGSQFELVVAGASFQPGAVVELDNPRVHMGAASVSCYEIRFATTVEPTAQDVRPAEIGPVTVTVTNPDGRSVSEVDLLEVLVEPSRFDVNQSDDATDGRLDGKDTVWLASLFGSRDGEAEYDPDFDFNGDGWVDGEELAYLGSNLGKCWDGSIWRASACSQ